MLRPHHARIAWLLQPDLDHLPLAVPRRVTGDFPFPAVDVHQVAGAQLEGEHAELLVGRRLGGRRVLERDGGLRLGRLPLVGCLRRAISSLLFRPARVHGVGEALQRVDGLQNRAIPVGDTVPQPLGPVLVLGGVLHEELGRPGQGRITVALRLVRLLRLPFAGAG